MLKFFSFVFVMLALVPQSQAAEKTFAYLVPGIATAPEGLYQVAAYRTAGGESDGSDHFGYHMVKLTPAGSLQIVSEELPIFASEGMDVRGYGLTQANWSVTYKDGQILFTGIAVLNVDTRRGNYKVIYELQEGVFKKSFFNSEAISASANHALMTELKKDPSMKDAFVYQAGYSLNLRTPTSPVGSNIVGNNFDLEEGLLGDFSVSFFVTPKNSENTVEYTVTNTITFSRLSGKLFHQLSAFTVKKEL